MKSLFSVVTAPPPEPPAPFAGVVVLGFGVESAPVLGAVVTGVGSALGASTLGSALASALASALGSDLDYALGASLASWLLLSSPNKL
jgi:hypothetical protein